MTEPRSDYTPHEALPVDREIEIAISDDHPAASLNGLDLNDPRIRIGLARALTHRSTTLQRYVDEMSAFVRESQLAQAPLVTAIEAIEERLADHVREWRRATKENTLTIPGIGVWSSRRQNPRWKIDNALLIESLDDDETARYTEKQPPPDPKLKRDEYIAEVLDNLISVNEEGEEIAIETTPTGVERIPAEVGVTYSLNV